MPLVPAVTELIVSELLYMQYTDASKPCYIYINSTGCQRADGEVVGFETEATSIYDTMKYIGNPIYTVGTGVAIGQACMILSAGDKGKRFMTTHATAMLHQPRVPSTGQRQAIELHIKWKEVLAQKRAMVDILASTTGHSKEKIDKDIQRAALHDRGGCHRVRNHRQGRGQVGAGHRQRHVERRVGLRGGAGQADEARAPGVEVNGRRVRREGGESERVVMTRFIFFF